MDDENKIPKTDFLYGQTDPRDSAKAGGAESRDNVEDVLFSLYAKKIPDNAAENDFFSETKPEAGQNQNPVHVDEVPTYEIGAFPVQPEIPDFTRTQTRPSAKEQRERRRQRRRRSAGRTAGHIFSGALLVIVITGLSVYAAYYIVRGALDFAGFASYDYSLDVSIPAYATTEEIAEILHNNGIVDLPILFTMYSKLTDKDGDYLDGTFTLNSTMTYGKIIDTLQSRVTVTHTITLTITEGLTAQQIGALLEENEVCRAADFEQYYKNKQNIYNFEKRVDQSTNKYYQLEGYLFPDTYEFYVIDGLAGDKDRDTTKEAGVAAKKMLAAFNDHITKEMYKRMYDMGLTLNDVVTLASMVQHEAGTDEDMKLVASVFLNRLRDSGAFPKLQSDVTILYIEDSIKPRLTERNLALYQPVIDAYNTYVADGLPPGPICSPGIDAIMAVLEAPATNYYYFCADVNTGEVFYAATQEQHEANLAKLGLVPVLGN